MQTNEYTRSLQLWPGGESVVVKGDASGKHLKIKLRDSKRFRAATPEERRAVRIEELAERYVEHEILCCDSSLVDDAIKLGFEEHGDFAKEWDMENVKNLRPETSEWTLGQCKEWLDDNGHDLPDRNPWAMTREQLIEEIHWGDKPDAADMEFQETAGETNLRARLIEDINDEYVGGLDEWREAVRDNANDAEIYQWFRVTDWFADQLDSIGEAVMDNAYGKWWGRQCCGQSIIMDGTMQRIAARHAD